MKRLYNSCNKPCILYCKSCHLSTSARKWQCACKRPWFACPLHRAQGFACKPSIAKQSQCNISINQPNKKPRIADPIRQLGMHMHTNAIDLHTSQHRSSITSSSAMTTSRHSHKRSASVQLQEPSSKRRRLCFSPGPKLYKRILAFDEDAV